MSKVAIIMGSVSDWPVMSQAKEVFESFDLNYEVMIVSAHRTPDKLVSFAKNAKDNGFQFIIAGAGGAAHLPGMVASFSTLPVIGIPIQSKALSGLDSLLSIVQMPYGVPVATMAINGAKNGALFVIQILAQSNASLMQKLIDFRIQNQNQVEESELTIK